SSEPQAQRKGERIIPSTPDSARTNPPPAPAPCPMADRQASQNTVPQRRNHAARTSRNCKSRIADPRRASGGRSCRDLATPRVDTPPVLRTPDTSFRPDNRRRLALPIWRPLTVEPRALSPRDAQNDRQVRCRRRRDNDGLRTGANRGRVHDRLSRFQRTPFPEFASSMPDLRRISIHQNASQPAWRRIGIAEDNGVLLCRESPIIGRSDAGDGPRRRDEFFRWAFAFDRRLTDRQIEPMGFAHSSILADANPSRYLCGGMPLGPEIAEALDLVAGPVHQNITFCRTALTRRRRAGVGFGARAFDTFPVRPSSRRIAALASTESECCAARSALIISGTPATRRMAA